MDNYNTQREPLLIREYGRNTQKLVKYAKNIPDRAERQAMIEHIVNLIMEMHPHTRNVDDYRLKVWSHVLRMADYELDIDLPDNIPAEKEEKKPDMVEYPVRNFRFRHYGRNVQDLIQKALTMEDNDKRRDFLKVIGAYMKMSYKAWNRESVTDEIIREEFGKLTEGKLQIPEGLNLDYLTNPRKRNKNSAPSTSQNNNNSKHKRFQRGKRK